MWWWEGPARDLCYGAKTAKPRGSSASSLQPSVFEQKQPHSGQHIVITTPRRGVVPTTSPHVVSPLACYPVLVRHKMWPLGLFAMTCNTFF